MEYMELFQQIKSKNLSHLYLLYGPEEFTKEEALNQIVETLVEPAYRDLNYQLIDGAETSADAIIAAGETLPFLAERRLLIVKNYPGFAGRQSGDEDAMVKFLQRLSKSTCLVFYQRGELDKRRVIYKTIQKHGEVVEFVRLNQRDLVSWARKRFRIHNKKITDPDLEYFLLQTGNNLEDIKNEVDKLAAYTGKEPSINRKSIDKLVTPSLEYTVFQFIDAVSARQKGTALNQIDALLDQGQSIFGIISLIGRQLKIMMLCKEYDEMGYTLNQIKDRLKEKPHGLHPYSVQKGMQQSRNFSMRHLKSAFDQSVELDYGIKNGLIRDRLGLEVLVIKMCRQDEAV